MSVQKLQTALHAKAKAAAGYRFYALYDKISREDILTRRSRNQEARYNPSPEGGVFRGTPWGSH